MAVHQAQLRHEHQQTCSCGAWDPRITFIGGDLDQTLQAKAPDWRHHTEFSHVPANGVRQLHALTHQQ